MELHRATSSGGAGAIKRCGSDSSYFELIFNIKHMFQNGTIFDSLEPCTRFK
jgi:hypothetical protein